MEQALKSTHPLKGIRVVDFSMVWAGPVLTFILGSMGAEIIKVESRKRFDSMRLGQDNVSQDIEKDPWFHNNNCNKLGVTIDFTQPRGASLLRDLTKSSNVVVENFAPGVLSKYGLGYESLKEVKPDIIMISLPGAGSYGPMADMVSYGTTIIALCGYDSLVGYEGERVLGMQQAFPDANAAVHGAFAVLAAIYHHRQTGEGQYIELAQWEAGTNVMGEAIMEYVMNGRVPGTQGNSHPRLAPHGNYPCQGEDKWVSIAIGSDEEWQNFCKSSGNASWIEEERFADGYGRWKNRKELDGLISEWTKKHTPFEVTEILQMAGVAAFPLLDIEEKLFDRHFQERKAYVNIEHPATGTDWVTNLPFKLSLTPGGITLPAPLLGQHNEYVFQNILGLPAEEVQKLAADGII